MTSNSTLALLLQNLDKVKKNKNSNQKHLKNITSLDKSLIEYKQHWKNSGTKPLVQKFIRLQNKHDLNSWEILRIDMSQRSYAYPKKYKGIKIPQKSRQFSNYKAEDKNGHLPYLYPNQIERFESIKKKIIQTPFIKTQKTGFDYFGYGNSCNRLQRSIKSQYIQSKNANSRISKQM